uniref:dynein light chain roadblock-type 2 isoform X1 n=1 Tax=Podarcis muralis TaxID=64176 RepID=UPI0010A00FFF|nr:dynein light chain roadblock-type 2 isoform X1 [Podarcis muralis]
MEQTGLQRHGNFHPLLTSKQASLSGRGKGSLKAAPRRSPASPAPATGGTTAEVEETLKRIQSHKGVIGTIVVNAEGIPIRTTLDNSTTVQYAGLLHQLTMKAKSTVRDIDPQNDLTFLRIRSKKHEIMVAPDKEYLLIVIQNPCE